MIDVGGTNVKLMASGHEGFRKVPSGRKLTAAQMAKEVLKATKDWKYDAVTIGFPGLVADGKIVSEPLNLGGGWLNFDYRKAFRKPVRFINDASMQALATYEAGRMLFLGFGTSTGATVIVDDVIVPLEVGMLCLPDGRRFIDRLTDDVKKRRGRRKWQKSAQDAIEMLRDVFKPDDIVLGGGNAKSIDPLPAGCRVQDNQGAFRGACRLWPGADMLAEAYGTSWRIRKHKPRPKRTRAASAKGKRGGKGK
jgi:polyphosphate glucokinase